MNETSIPVVTPYERLGGDLAVRRLVDTFYDRMSDNPAFAGLRRLHPDDLNGSRDKLFWFLCGWLGGPQHYVKRFGHPRLRARHLPFSIGVEERDQWLACMELAMQDCEVPAELRQELGKALASTADFMRNRFD